MPRRNVQRLIANLPPNFFLWVFLAIGLLVGVWLAVIVLNVLQARRRDPGRRVCPDCQGTDVRPSYPGGVRDNFYRMFGCEPYRCRACNRRFYRPERHRLVGEAESN